ncbi:MAG: pilus (MSHA type) biogenesis protein MshL [Gammaproteobacteria bacterium]|nr:pilus (MSHA type) biogenesis protein MshL [Gammaproteobacteria bacterium]
MAAAPCNSGPSELLQTFLAPLLLLAACLLAAGCESKPVRTQVLEGMEGVIEESVQANAETEVPKSVTSALIPTISLGSSELPEARDAQRFDVAVSDVPAAQFFMSLVDGTPYNMVVHPEVRGSITLNLNDVTIPEVLEAVRDVYGFEFVSTEYGFQVLPGRLQARIYQINYLNVLRSGRSQTIVSSGSLTTSREGVGMGGDAGAGIVPGAPASRESSVVGTVIQTAQPEALFWEELARSVTAIVGTGEGRSVVVNPQSGVVVVRALPTELREVESFLRATQLVVQRQVILEAKILEVRLNDDFQTGINWSSLLKPGNNAITASTVGGGSVLVNESGTSDIAGSIGTLNPADPNFIDGAVTSAFGGVFTLALDLTDFTAFIELLKTQGNVQVLSSPRVATLNNQKAVIKVGTDEFFVTDITSTATTSAVGTNFFPTIELTPFFSGIALDVTPQISEDGRVTLHIHPSVSDVVDQQKTVTIGTLVQQIPLALSTIRESDSIVRARNGQVVVIGGLMQDTVNDQEAGAPGLSDVPVLGHLFKHSKKRSVKSELVILLRPVVVVDDEDTWSDELKKSGAGLDRLKKELEQRN